MSDLSSSLPVAAEPALQRLQDQLRQTIAARQALVIQGQGSKAFLLPGAAPAGLPVLDVQPLAGISSYEPSELVVTVRAGTPLIELEAALAERGQVLAFEPPRFPGADGRIGGTVGGMVAAGLAGPARASVGSVRDYVLGGVILNGRAELLRFGGQVMKNVAGYDVARLLAGSNGALGVICEVSLKVLPCPAAQTTLRLALDQATALKTLLRWSRQPLPLQASAWFEGVLHVRLAGAVAAVEAACRSLGGERLDPADADAFWLALRDQTQPFFVDHFGAAQPKVAGLRLWRLSVPPHATAIDLPGIWLVEWHGGQRWLLSAAEPAQVQQAAARAGGHASVWRCSRADDQVAPPALPNVLRELHTRVKNAFDPLHLLNPGRVPGL